ncbi:alpha/beta hydrolase [Pediococcus stilesii]|uniref:alpha/beta hydrolase n=1 Tax=Pediococcus stilesii TaxID=331679 RepID=UPI001F3FD91B|nr:alpha/beta hydrolase [Pediococcus stilesii]
MSIVQIFKNKLNQTNSTSKAELISYVDPSLTDSKSPSIIFVPGGSYTHIDFKQSEKIALRFLSYGFQFSILRYSFVDEVSPLFPAPLIELAEAINTTRQNSENWQIDSKKVILMGFSVGGHIVSNFNNSWKSDWLTEKTGIKSDLLQPFATILGFPVITPEDGFPDADTLSTWSDNPQMIAADQHVTSDNAPTFIWATADDSLVSSANSVHYFLALQSKKVPSELHLFQHGPHGMALADETTAYDERHADARISEWSKMAIDWLQELS